MTLRELATSLGLTQPGQLRKLRDQARHIPGATLGPLNGDRGGPMTWHIPDDVDLAEVHKLMEPGPFQAAPAQPARSPRQLQAMQDGALPPVVDSGIASESREQEPQEMTNSWLPWLILILATGVLVYLTLRPSPNSSRS